MAELGPLNLLLQNYLNATKGSEAVFIVKRDGTIITSIIQPGFNEREIGGITTLISYISDIIRIDFENLYFRKSAQSINTPGRGFVFRQINPETILVTIYDETVSKQVITAYSVYIANKADKILKGEFVSPEVPTSEEKIKEEIKPRNEYVFKVVIIGDAGVGKTTTTVQFAHAKFQSEYKPTIGVSIVKNEYWIDEDLAIFQIWDIAGQSFWKDMRRIYYGGAQGCLILYDVTRPMSFKNVQKWHEEVNSFVPSKIPCIMCANKIDLVDERKVTSEEGKQAAEKYNMSYAEISAKTSENLDEVFHDLGKRLMEEIQSRKKK